MGGPDEGRKDWASQSSNEPGHGWYKDRGILQFILDCSNTPSNPIDMSSGYSCLDYYQDAAKGLIDTEPDLFTYNISGYSGKFYFAPDRSVIQLPKSDIRIIPIYDAVENIFSGWEIMTPDGTFYEFGGAEATETSYTDVTGVLPGFSDNLMSSTSWFLKKISSANRHHYIEFSYEVEQYGFSNRLSQTAMVEASCSITGIQNAPQVLMTNIVDGRRLSVITTGSGFTTLNFNASIASRSDLTRWNDQSELTDEAKYLHEIEIINPGFCKKIVLSHSYFYSSENSGYPTYSQKSGADLKRLKLLSVQEISCSGSKSVPPYSFYYDETPLARRLSLARDHWGYYNGAVANQSLIPEVTYVCSATTITNGNANRDPSEFYMQAGILREIYYPMGGFTSFKYEAHRIDAQPDYLGGLRIKEITSFDGIGGPPIKKEYQYYGGRLYSGEINYVSFPNDSYWGNTYGIDFGIVIRSSPRPALQSTQGYHVGYGKVEEHFQHGGYTSYFFNNVTPSITFNVYPTPPQVAVIGAAEQRIQQTFDNSNTKVAANETEFDYADSYSFNARKVTTLDCNGSTGSGCPALFIFFTTYPIYSSRFRPKVQISELDNVQTSTSYTYDPSNRHDNAITIEFQNSNGDIVTTKRKYPLDTSSIIPDLMLQRNMTGVMIEESNYTNDNISAKKFNSYKSDIYSNVFLDYSTYFPHGSESNSITTNYEYDQLGNIINIFPQNKAPVTFIWGFDGKLPIA